MLPGGGSKWGKQVHLVPSLQEHGGNRGCWTETPQFGPRQGRSSSAGSDGIALGCIGGDEDPKGLSILPVKNFFLRPDLNLPSPQLLNRTDKETQQPVPW